MPCFVDARGFAMAIAIVALIPSAASADAVLVPLRGEEAIVARHGEEVIAATRAHLAARGESARTSDEIALPDGLVVDDECSLACIEAVLSSAGAERAVAIGLWSDGAGLSKISVSLVDAAGAEVGADVDVGDRPVVDALRDALDRALAAWPSREGIEVAVIGSPAAASVVVDRQPFGALPARGRLALGEHRLVVSHPGFATERRVLSVVPTSELLTVRVDLAREGAERARRGWVAGPVALALGAGALAVEPARALVLRGCDEWRGDLCRAETRIDAPIFAAYVAGAAALATGAVVWAVAGARRHRSSPVRAGLGTLSVEF